MCVYFWLSPTNFERHEKVGIPLLEMEVGALEKVTEIQIAQLFFVIKIIIIS